MIRLDYYRLLPEIKYIGVVDEPDTDCHYTPYSVFILETRLYPLIYKLFPNLYLQIYLKSLYNKEKNRMDVYLVIEELANTDDPFIENKLVILTQEQRDTIQDKINEIQTNYIHYALIDLTELYETTDKQIPFSYFSLLLQYTGIDSSFNPFIRPEGIYLSFSPNSDYKEAYYQTCKFLLSRVEEFYQKGAIVLENMQRKEELVRNWNLVSIDSEEVVSTIYQPNWKDDRFAKNMVDFLIRKVEGDPNIEIKVPDNLVKRHGIAVALQQFPIKFEGSYLKVEVKNLEEAQKVASSVTSAIHLTNGKVLVLSSKRLGDIRLYLAHAKEKYGINKAVMYISGKDYIFSCMVPEKEDLDELRLEFRDYAVERLINVSKISKFKNMSPHLIIEQELSI